MDEVDVIFNYNGKVTTIKCKNGNLKDACEVFCKITRNKKDNLKFIYCMYDDEEINSNPINIKVFERNCLSTIIWNHLMHIVRNVKINFVQSVEKKT